MPVVYANATPVPLGRTFVVVQAGEHQTVRPGGCPKLSASSSSQASNASSCGTSHTLLPAQAGTPDPSGTQPNSSYVPRWDSPNSPSTSAQTPQTWPCSVSVSA